jgi:large subunit ribosomal protein L35
MVICAVDYRQMHILTGKLLRCLKPSKACTDNDHLRLLPCGRLHPANCTMFDSLAPAGSPFGLPAASFCEPRKHSGLVQPHHNKAFVIAPTRINFPPRMPKPIARSKTRKAVAKRFKITARGKVLRSRSSRRHLLSSKSAKRRRRLGKAALVDDTDVARVKANLPFG